MRVIGLTLAAVVASLGATRGAEDPARVSTSADVDALDDEVTAVEVRFDGSHDEDVLRALASKHPELETLILRATGRNGVRPLDALADFEGLRHLEVYDSTSNLCYVGEGESASELSIIASLTKLETLVFEVG